MDARTTQTIRLDEALTHYLVTGHGPPLVLLHGCPGSNFSWRANLGELARHHTVYALHLKGFGPGASPRREDLSLEAHARFVHRFLIEQGLTRAFVIGHSMGAAVGLHLAAQAPERVARLALLAPLGVRPHLSLRLLRFPGVPWYMTHVAPRFPRAVRKRMSQVFHWMLYNELARLQPQEVQRETLELTAPEVLEATVRTARQANCGGLKAVCELVRAPVMIIHGTDDRLVPFTRARELASHLPGSALVPVERTGHMLMVERAEQVNQLLLRFSADVVELPTTARELTPAYA